MGQRLDQPDIEYGNDCGFGETFDPPLWLPGKTPKHVYAEFFGIKHCDKPLCEPYPLPPNGRIFKLTQDPVNACFWSYLSDYHVIWWMYEPYPITCKLQLRWPSPGPIFFESTFDPNGVPAWCHSNELTCSVPLACGEEGKAVIQWGARTREIMEALNMEFDYSTFSEMFPQENCHRVVKLTRRQDGTNIKILVEP